MTHQEIKSALIRLAAKIATDQGSSFDPEQWPLPKSASWKLKNQIFMSGQQIHDRHLSWAVELRRITDAMGKE